MHMHFGCIHLQPAIYIRDASASGQQAKWKPPPDDAFFSRVAPFVLRAAPLLSRYADWPAPWPLSQDDDDAPNLDL
jgi:hypothetical protein